MCGLVGLLSPHDGVDRALLRAMTDRIVPRGPDSSGEWVGADGLIGLGHRRLAVLDLSEAGHQPMHSACGRYTIAYNGEIYNFAELRAELEAGGKAPPWRGHSDTEVLLAAIAAWGLRAALERAAGMFAFALWDHARRELTLARDRFGEKPLYYGWVGRRFVFASTLAPLRAVPGFGAAIDRPALASLLTRGYVPAPLSIFGGIFKLPQGCMLTIDVAGATTPLASPPVEGQAGAVRLDRWFDHGQQLLDGARDPIDEPEAALDALETTITAAIRRQLVADVPVGVFLSGGIDSSLVAALAQQVSARPVKTFTIGFHEPELDEAKFAREVSHALGTEHHCLYISGAAAQEVIPRLPAIYDEPFADNSQIPTHIVSALARQSVTVALSGDGGDELFGGYPRYAQVAGMWRQVSRIPAPLRRQVLRSAGTVPPRAWQLLAHVARIRHSPRFGDNAQRSLRLLAQAHDFGGLFDRVLDDWALHPAPLAGGARIQQRLALDPRLAGLGLEAQLMHCDAQTYLADDILTKVDRAAMAVSLETRVPLLDPAVTALAARIPHRLKFGPGGGKWILKQLLYRKVPRELVDRPKSGFGIPVGEWLRTDLRDWAEDLLSPAALGAERLLDVKAIRARWAAHLAGHEDAAQPLWSVLMYQAWRAAV